MYNISMDRKLDNAYWRKNPDGSGDIYIMDWHTNQPVIVWTRSKMTQELERLFGQGDRPWPTSAADWEPPASP